MIFDVVRSVERGFPGFSDDVFIVVLHLSAFPSIPMGHPENSDKDWFPIHRLGDVPIIPTWESIAAYLRLVRKKIVDRF